jgi:hypothetical protein
MVLYSGDRAVVRFLCRVAYASPLECLLLKGEKFKTDLIAVQDTLPDLVFGMFVQELEECLNLGTHGLPQHPVQIPNQQDHRNQQEHEMQGVGVFVGAVHV